MYRVMQSMTHTLQQVRRGVLEKTAESEQALSLLRFCQYKPFTYHYNCKSTPRSLPRISP